MPKILIYKFLTFYFYAGDINERGHVHIVNSKSNTREAKIWFEGTISIFEKGNFTQTELNQALKLLTVRKII